MASRKFNVYRYRYESDSGDIFIREHRIQVDSNSNQEILPVTGIFLSSVVSFPNEQAKIKAEKFNNKERRATVVYKNTKGEIKETDRYIPYNDEVRIRNQLKEQSEYDNVICLSYKGESRDYQLTRIKP